MKLKKWSTESRIKTSYDSSYLINLKSKTTSAFYISILSILFVIVSPSIFQDIVILNFPVSYFFLAIGVVILLYAIYSATRLPGRTLIVNEFAFMLEASSHEEILRNTVGRALTTGDWGLAKISLNNLERNISLQAVSSGLKRISEFLQNTMKYYISKDEVFFWQNLMSFRKVYDESISDEGLSTDLELASHDLHNELREIYQISLNYKEKWSIINSGQVTPQRNQDVIDLRKNAIEDKNLDIRILTTVESIENLLHPPKGLELTIKRMAELKRIGAFPHWFHDKAN